ncbi:MAG TPA: allene oxide cyclase family protein [Acetobacteraceae bacterium]|nr:allene oxide cyclase family protein [Acetobacteraceae bacterium]
MRELCVAACLAVAVPVIANAAEVPRQIHVIEHAVTDTTAHIGAKADNLGDVLTFTNPVFDDADKHEVGTDQGYCVRVAVGKSFECIWTLLLATGQITVEGPFYDAGDSKLAVTGGTGAYVDAQGEMNLHARDTKGSAYDFTYTLR